MRKLFLVLISTVVLVNAFAQEDATIRKIQKEVSQTIKKDIADATAWTTKKGGLINVNLTQ
ncbi:MAG: hypothetical protein JWQ96_953, partial [Segetibacter sp.]|nr:hypothetical protein [Segetibacter sp.]